MLYNLGPVLILSLLAWHGAFPEADETALVRLKRLL